ncbi:hypothetical protein BMF94_2256 [Rhodotorula taiwanensis]|uniref:Uncharacterized protein n=1 Tax=Rhodotorula taiwanensis TaxID=741276 RepID=A0A2S5BCI6_9BASI|nr:hypothetical protein BMF94_2256 [Rhodotorula taiwanensis]
MSYDAPRPYRPQLASPTSYDSLRAPPSITTWSDASLSSLGEPGKDRYSVNGRQTPPLSPPALASYPHPPQRYAGPQAPTTTSERPHRPAMLHKPSPKWVRGGNGLVMPELPAPSPVQQAPLQQYPSNAPMPYMAAQYAPGGPQPQLLAGGGRQQPPRPPPPPPPPQRVHEKPGKYSVKMGGTGILERKEPGHQKLKRVLFMSIAGLLVLAIIALIVLGCMKKL